MRRYIVQLFLVITGGLTQAQTIVSGLVVDNDSGNPLAAVKLQIKGSIIESNTNAQGVFKIVDPELPLGEQILLVSKEGYISQRFHIVVNQGQGVHLDRIFLELDLSKIEAQIGIISLSDAQLDGEDASVYTISGLLQASNDVFLNAAAFDFSATFFRPRGYDNSDGKLLINGIEMNKSFSGRPQWANWGGLNDAQRNREFDYGLKANSYQFGGLAGTTNIIMRASQYSKGGRVSYAMANRSYQGRVMASYHSGLNSSGWAYSVLVSRRFGEEAYVHGTFYDANSFFIAVEKKLNSNHSLNFTGIYTPNRRGRAAPMTQEIHRLKGRRYNPNWGVQNGQRRNSRVRTIKEPIIMLNHYWTIGSRASLNTNIAYQFGSVGNTRIDNGGTRRVTFNGQDVYLGGARNPSPDYYQNLPSFYLQAANPSAVEFQNAYLVGQQFQNYGQLDWASLYRANQVSAQSGGNAVYAIQEDRTDDTQLSANTIFSTQLNDRIIINASLNYRMLRSDNYARLSDLLGGSGFLDIDFFAEDDVNTAVGVLAQSDLQNPNRIVTQGDRYKYNYQLSANTISGFAQARFSYSKLDLYLTANLESVTYQRSGLYENGNFPGSQSLGQSEKLGFSTYGIKTGLLYKYSGRHMMDLNAAILTKAPTLRKSFINPRQNNFVVPGLKPESLRAADLSYIYRSPLIKGRLTGFYTEFIDATDIGFFFSQAYFGPSNKAAFVQEVITGINTRHAGVELGVEAQLTPTFKLKAAASLGQFVYTNNPKVFYASDDFRSSDISGPVTETFSNGTINLKNYHLAGGPERAYQLGFEYRDPNYWWVGLTVNHFSNAYVDVSNIRRTAAFTQDADGITFNDYDPEFARRLLQQEQLPSYCLVNVVGGKSWRIGRYYVGFFATINNVLDQEYITGGFEQSRLASYRDLLAEQQNSGGPLFGNRYFFGRGTTFYVNFYLRF